MLGDIWVFQHLPWFFLYSYYCIFLISISVLSWWDEWATISGRNMPLLSFGVWFFICAYPCFKRDHPKERLVWLFALPKDFVHDPLTCFPWLFGQGWHACEGVFSATGCMQEQFAFGGADPQKHNHFLVSLAFFAFVYMCWHCVS